jgi:2-octaprenylphenol hydroxylase
MAEPRRDTEVLIVGGGIAGLALAAALQRSGLRVVLVEGRDFPEASSAAGGEPADDVADFDPRVSALTPRSIAFLASLGVWTDIEALRQQPYSHMTVWDAEGTGRIEFDADEVAAPSLGSIVENRLVVAALAARVRALGGVGLRNGVRLRDLQRTADGFRVHFDDDSSLDAALVVAADGALSPTRKLLGLRTREWDYGHRAIVTTVQFSDSHRCTAWQRFLPTGPLALLPLAGRNERFCSIVWSIDEDRADALLQLDDDEFGRALTRASEGVLGAVTQSAPRHAFPLRQRHAVDYVCPGAALVGDAAHTIHPLAGQGINLGLADVAVLAEELGRAARLGLAPGRLEVLRRYQRRRKGDNLRMMAAMDGFKRLFGADALPLRWLRNTGMRGLAGMPAAKRRIIREAMGVA